MAKIAIVNARYVERANLEAFLGRVFNGKASVKWKRSVFHCRLPRGLTQSEFDDMKLSVNFEHYDES
ncbi:hypothetical protein K458DRAFT_414707 [Lentithecium fluviatile CBS 122367]|uniref:Uncharacterized protein n=1 Tax=Lentithecium fluviatile CBS 122367 TaxID=1168545 RepID=A0A6G1JBM7_9PLEO|nr:hypothetical protein K458DRAFT_414707 [Lentithecium fluviatile CBS 122367]